MSDIRLSQLTALSTPASGDILFINDVSDTTQSASGSSKSITFGDLLQDYALEANLTVVSGDLSTHIADTTTHGTTGNIVGTSDTQTLTNKTLTSPKINENVALMATSTQINDIYTAWTSFTPTWTNITVGSGSSVGYYKQVGKTVIGYVQFIYGSGSSVGAVSLTPPVTPKTGVAGSSVNLGQVIIEDSGSNYFFGSWIAAGPIYVGNSSSTYVSGTALSSSIPMTWVTGDKLSINFCYEAS